MKIKLTLIILYAVSCLEKPIFIIAATILRHDACNVN